MSLAKEKAQELVNEFYYALPNNGSINIGLMNCSQRWAEAIICALIEIKNLLRVAIFAKQEIYEFYLDVRIELEKIKENNEK
jgi:hypothetical protein